MPPGQTSPPSPPSGGWRMPRPFVVAVVSLLVALALIGWFSLRGGSEGGTPLSPIAQAAERTASYNGARFSGTGSATAAGSQMQMQFEGAYNAAEQRSTVEMRMQATGATSISTTITGVQDGLTSYMTSPLFAGQMPSGATWMKIDLGEVSPGLEGQSASSIDAQGMLESLRAVAPGAGVVATERVRGVKTTHYTATIDPELQAEQYREAGDDLAAEMAEQAGGSAVIDVWIDERGLVRRVAMSIPFGLIGGPSAVMRMTTDYYDFGATPEIALPAQAEVFDATALAKQGLEAELGG